MQAKRILVCLLAAGLVLAPMARASAAEDSYVRGYVEAVLDTRFTDKEVKVLNVQEERVLLAVGGCLSEADRAAIELALVATGRVKGVEWSDFVRCEDAPAPVSAPVAAEAEAVVEPLPPYSIFAPVLADPHQPQFSMRYQRYHSSVREFNAAMVSFGEYFGFASRLWRDASISQVGLQGAVFALFNLDAPSSDLVNADYWIGIPLSYRTGPWSMLARLYHQSSHLGDEFLLGHPGVNRINLSYEELEGLLSLDLDSVRLYGGGGYIVHSEPDLRPWRVQAGIEGRKHHLISSWDLIAAVDMQSRQEQGWRWNRSYQVGFAFKHRGGREIRLIAEHFNGFSPNGQFYRERLRYTGFGVYFGF